MTRTQKTPTTTSPITFAPAAEFVGDATRAGHALADRMVEAALDHFEDSGDLHAVVSAMLVEEGRLTHADHSALAATFRAELKTDAARKAFLAYDDFHGDEIRCVGRAAFVAGVAFGKAIR